MTTITNEQRSAAEVAAFKAGEHLGDGLGAYFAYPSSDFRRITTWTGDTLAWVTSRGREWRSNLGDPRQSFTAKGIDGHTYSGTRYMGTGDYVRMRKVKG